MRYLDELEKQALIESIKEKKTKEQICRDMRIPPATYVFYRDLAISAGLLPDTYKPKRGKPCRFTVEEIAEKVIPMIRKNMKNQDIAKALNVNRFTLSQWLSKVKKAGFFIPVRVGLGRPKKRFFCPNCGHELK